MVQDSDKPTQAARVLKERKENSRRMNNGSWSEKGKRRAIAAAGDRAWRRGDQVGQAAGKKLAAARGRDETRQDMDGWYDDAVRATGAELLQGSSKEAWGVLEIDGRNGERCGDTSGGLKNGRIHWQG